MTISIGSLSASPQLAPVLPAPSAEKNTAPAREAPVGLDGAREAAGTSTAEESEALAEINESLKIAFIGVRFEFDKEANTMITKVVDVESGERIRQMPNEEVVRISRALGKLQGLLVSQKI